MPDVRVGQKKIAVTQRSFAAALLRAAADSHVFAENVAVANHQFGALAAEGIVLWVAANRAERIKRVILAEPRRSPNRRVCVQHAAVA